jgi:anti-sigma-K factor RskA
MWDPDLKEGELVVSALPAPEADKSYQLWLFDSEHPAGKSIAVFAVDSRSIQVRVPFKLGHSGAAGASFKVSIERKGGASIPGGPVVLASR